MEIIRRISTADFDAVNKASFQVAAAAVDWAVVVVVAAGQLGRVTAGRPNPVAGRVADLTAYPVVAFARPCL